MITAKVIADSTAKYGGKRITTLELEYPRFIHSEFMTHRMFSRNASSSRAIPVRKQLERIRKEPAMPISWGQNQPGMQASKEVSNTELAKEMWLRAAQQACDMAETMIELDLHKQVVNRILEPFAHIRVLVTSTEWENFFRLRDHPDAMPEIQELAIQMKKAMVESVPAVKNWNEWHLPFVMDAELASVGVDTALMLSTARCARVSYLNHDGSNPDFNKDVQLYHQLVGSTPIHASPSEHQATPMSKDKTSGSSGNFIGWIQHRKLIEKQFQ